MTDIVFKEKYVPAELLAKIRSFIDKTNDKLVGGPIIRHVETGSDLMKEGGADRPLRLENIDNPIHDLIPLLKEDFGNFYIHTCSIRYIYYPYSPHTDVRNNEDLIKNRKNYRHGYTFIIPLSWKSGCNPGTTFFDSPPKEGQELYVEHQDVLTKMQNESRNKNFGVKRLVSWKNPGDLVAWMNYQYHGSLVNKDYPYNDNEWCKEFISIETFRYKDL